MPEVAAQPDIELSDDFGLSNLPEKAKQPARTTRASSQTRSSSTYTSAAASRGRKTGEGVPKFPALKPKLIGRAASLGRIGRPPRDPSPALPRVPAAPASALQQHSGTIEDGYEIRIKALETQNGETHRFLVDLAVAVRGIVQNVHHRAAQKDIMGGAGGHAAGHVRRPEGPPRQQGGSRD